MEATAAEKTNGRRALTENIDPKVRIITTKCTHFQMDKSRSNYFFVPDSNLFPSQVAQKKNQSAKKCPVNITENILTQSC